MQPAAPAWVAALDAQVRAAVRRPFQWGEHDCATFAARCWAARTGSDALAGLAWASEAEAQAIIDAGGGLRALVVARLGEPRAPLLAAHGDVVLALDPQAEPPREVLAVCVGQHHVAPGTRGLIVLPLEAATAAWSA